MSNRVCIVIIKCICRQIELRTFHLHVIIEDRHLCLCVVFSPIRRQCRVTVNHLAPFKEIGIIIQTVKIKTIRIKSRLSVFQYHIVTSPGHLFIAVVISIITKEGKRVTLIHLDMTKSLKGIACLIEISTITIKSGTDMGEMHLAIQNRCIRVLILIEMQHIGMHQIDTFILWRSFSCRTFLCCTIFLCINRQACHKRQQTKESEDQEYDFS